MEKKIYNKLVRDKISAIVKSKGAVPETRILEKEEISEHLNKKLGEEVQEFLEDNTIEELADIYEVLLAILDERKISFEEFEKIRRRKQEERGSFTKRIFLISVEE